MGRFRYCYDPLFLLGGAAYLINRLLLKPHFHNRLLHSYFNDLWLVPCALPLILWIHRRLGLRSHDKPPQLLEITLHLVFWSIFFEWIGPALVSHTTGDFGDVLAYGIGAVAAGLWWHREQWLPVPNPS